MVSVLAELVAMGGSEAARRTTRSTVSGRASEAAKCVTRGALEKATVGDIVIKTRISRSFFTSSPKKEGVCRASPRWRRSSVMSDEGFGELSSSQRLVSSPRRGELSPRQRFGEASPGLLLDIPPAIARPRHRLNQAWTIWHYKNDKSLSWGENQEAVGTVATVEEFWQLHQLLLPPSALPAGADYAMFRAGVRPDWEHPSNAGGGRWLARREHQQVDAAWLHLLFFLVGEHAGELAGHITGAVVNVRRKGDKVGVWVRDATNLTAVVEVGRKVRGLLTSNTDDKIQFSIHKEEREREVGRERPLPILL